MSCMWKVPGAIHWNGQNRSHCLQLCSSKKPSVLRFENNAKRNHENHHHEHMRSDCVIVSNRTNRKHTDTICEPCFKQHETKMKWITCEQMRKNNIISSSSSNEKKSIHLEIVNRVTWMSTLVQCCRIHDSAIRGRIIQSTIHCHTGVCVRAVLLHQQTHTTSDRKLLNGSTFVLASRSWFDEKFSMNFGAVELITLLMILLNSHALPLRFSFALFLSFCHTLTASLRFHQHCHSTSSSHGNSSLAGSNRRLAFTEWYAHPEPSNHVRLVFYFRIFIFSFLNWFGIIVGIRNTQSGWVGFKSFCRGWTPGLEIASFGSSEFQFIPFWIIFSIQFLREIFQAFWFHMLSFRPREGMQHRLRMLVDWPDLTQP